MTLSFAPGDGGSAVICPGPGTALKATTETWVAPVNPQGCSRRYRKSSYEIGGDDQVTAYTPSRFSVAELHTVVIR
ncbi:MAG TPA: hypothetical protein VGN48_15290 [Pedococcus sp.]|jgi:hypothetical protein|nr:hypothetical protein [Pedococcus sp.]